MSENTVAKRALKAFACVAWVEWKIGVADRAIANIDLKYKDGEIVVPFQVIVAGDEAEARMLASRKVPDDALAIEYRVEVAVRTF